MKPKSDAGKGKPKAKPLSINKDTVQSLSDEDLGKVQGGRRPTIPTAGCTNLCGTQLEMACAKKQQ